MVAPNTVAAIRTYFIKNLWSKITRVDVISVADSVNYLGIGKSLLGTDLMLKNVSYSDLKLKMEEELDNKYIFIIGQLFYIPFWWYYSL